MTDQKLPVQAKNLTFLPRLKFLQEEPTLTQFEYYLKRFAQQAQRDNYPGLDIILSNTEEQQKPMQTIWTELSKLPWIDGHKCQDILRDTNEVTEIVIETGLLHYGEESLAFRLILRTVKPAERARQRLEHQAAAAPEELDRLNNLLHGQNI